MKQPIFIHIPKTGGTTLNAAMQGTYWQTTPGFHYRHILADKTSNSGDIFSPETMDNFKGETIFMMLRHPVDRLLSEYYFIKERNEFTDLIKPKPDSLEAYVNHPQTQNYVVGFLKGKRMYDEVPVNEQDLEDVLNAIDKLDVKTGIFEYFADSMAYISQKTGVQWNDKVEMKRVTFRRPKADDITDEMKELILEKNALDFKLYQYCLEKFQKESAGIKGTVSFHGDKYDHAIAFAARACFYEFCLSDKSLIKQNFKFFRDLTIYLLNNLKIKDGRVFVKMWNETFLRSFQNSFPDNELTEKLLALPLHPEDPIEHSFLIGQEIDNYFKENKTRVHRFRNMVFKAEFTTQQLLKQS